MKLHRVLLLLLAPTVAVAAGQPFVQRSKFTTDGSYWLWVYEKRRSAAQFNAVMDRVKDGHITVPMTVLCVTYGGMPAEAVLRSMDSSAMWNRIARAMRWRRSRVWRMRIL